MDIIKKWSSKIFRAECQKTDSYEAKFAQEISNYSKLYESENAKEKMAYDTPHIWKNVDMHMYHKVSKITESEGMIGYVAKFCNAREGKIRILTLGSGPCQLELTRLAPQIKKEFEIIAVDINETLSKIALERASADDITFSYQLQDINRLELESSRYDVIIAFASLHHFLELEHIAHEINKGLKDGGIFVTLDIPTRNGYRLWEETRPVINGIMKMLPAEFRYNHYTKAIDQEYIDNDLSVDSFECINSEAIIPSLRKYMKESIFVPAHSIARRFFDNMYGFNFDRVPDFGSAFQKFVFMLDDYYIDHGLLKPETFFGVYLKK